MVEGTSLSMYFTAGEASASDQVSRTLSDTIYT